MSFSLDFTPPAVVLLPLESMLGLGLLFFFIYMIVNFIVTPYIFKPFFTLVFYLCIVKRLILSGYFT